MIKKRDIVSRAFTVAGIASEEFDIAPDQWQTGLLHLDALLASLTGSGYDLGVSAPTSLTSSSLDDLFLVPVELQDAIINKVAFKICGSLSKEPSRVLLMAQNAADAIFSGRYNGIKKMQFSETLPMGAAYYPWAGRFFCPITEETEEDEMVTTDQVKAIVDETVGEVVEESLKRATQIAEITANDMQFTVRNVTGNILVLVNPLQDYATLTIKLPAASLLKDQQEVEIRSTGRFSNLIFDANGAASLQGMPTSIAPNQYFSLMYLKSTSTWIRSSG